MRKLSLFGLAGALAVTTAACGSADQTDAAVTPATDDAMAGASPTASMAAPGEAAMSAQAFVDAAAASDMFEVESAKLAQTMSKSPDEQAFAKMMIADHTGSTADLKAAAAKVTPAVTVTAKLTAEQQADLDALRGAGDDFDDLYAQKQVAAHEKALAMLRAYAAGGHAAPLKDFAGKTAPVVEGHLATARKLP